MYYAAGSPGTFGWAEGQQGPRSTVPFPAGEATVSGSGRASPPVPPPVTYRGYGQAPAEQAALEAQERVRPAFEAKFGHTLPPTSAQEALWLDEAIKQAKKAAGEVVTTPEGVQITKAPRPAWPQLATPVLALGGLGLAGWWFLGRKRRANVPPAVPTGVVLGALAFGGLWLLARAGGLTKEKPAAPPAT